MADWSQPFDLKKQYVRRTFIINARCNSVYYSPAAALDFGVVTAVEAGNALLPEDA
jgi:hypothetical protein